MRSTKTRKRCLHSSPSCRFLDPSFQLGGDKQRESWQSQGRLDLGRRRSERGCWPRDRDRYTKSRPEVGPALILLATAAITGGGTPPPQNPEGPPVHSPATGTPVGCKAPFCALTKMRSLESDVPLRVFKAFRLGAWPEEKRGLVKAGLRPRRLLLRAPWAEFPVRTRKGERTKLQKNT